VADWTLPGYTELRELGTGSFGRVTLARRHDPGETLVAIKYLFTERLGGEHFLTLFRDEARTLARLRSPHITRLYEYVETDANAAIVMEAVRGASLRAVLDRYGPADPEAALAVLKGSLLGLAAAHAAGIVHRDYKPENVLVQDNGQSKIADFGIAVRTGSTGSLAGTPSYMAPEQWEGAPAAPATDVYAATCVFFECLTGHRPYGRDSRERLRARHLAAPVPGDEVPQPVRALVLRGMAKNPTDRPATATAFVQELEAIATEAYGPVWEQNGVRRLAHAATGLVALLPIGLALGTATGGGAVGGGIAAGGTAGGGAAGGAAGGGVAGGGATGGAAGGGITGGGAAGGGAAGGGAAGGGAAGGGAAGGGAGGGGAAGGGVAGGGASGGTAGGGAGGGAAGGGSAGSGTTAGSNAGGSAGGGTAGGGTGAGYAGGAGGRTAGKHLLAKAGTKSAAAVLGAIIAGTAGIVAITHNGKGGHRPPPPVVAKPTPLSIAFVSLNQRFTNPSFDVAGRYVRVGGLKTPAIEQSVNQALRAPLDHRIDRYRTQRQPSNLGTPTAKTAIELGLRGPRLLSVRYRFDAGDKANLDRSEMFVSRAITVDLTTGARLRAADILRPEILTPAGIQRLLQRIGKSAPDGSICPGGWIGSSQQLSSSGVDNDDDRARYLDLMPTSTGIEFNVLPNRIGYIMVCDEAFVTIPYDKISDLLRPGLAAEIQSSTATPAPSPS
jgi:hypothetical protein